MRTIIHGRVTPDTLANADLIAGITPTSMVTMGAKPDLDLPLTVFPPCDKLGEMAVPARDYTLVQNADAAIVVGRNPHLVQVARQYGLPVYQEV